MVAMPAKALGFYLLSFTQEKLDTGIKATVAWHRTKAQYWTVIVREKMACNKVREVL